MYMGTQILVRTQGEPQDMLHGIRQQIASMNPDQQTSARVDDLETWIKREPSWARSRLMSILFAAFSGLALTLVAIGLYSVVSYSVVQRTGEFGIRMALGAQRVHVLRMVLLSAASSVGLGLAVGLGLSLGLRRMVSHWLNQQAHDPFIAFGVSLLIIAISALACLIPARRALSVDPMTALRQE
jgi:ABC-type antimicrobial peptide transport system permease subunit